MFRCCILFCCLALLLPVTLHAREGDISVVDYPSIQDAINANPGRMIYLPEGEYEIAKKIVLNKDNSGLYGYGRIIQTNPDTHVLEIEHARGIRVENITVTRAVSDIPVRGHGICIRDAAEVRLTGVRVINCTSRAAAIDIMETRNCTVENCEVINYKCITVDDRTHDPVHWGYAFRAIDGSGIHVGQSTGAVLRNNRIIETDLLPTLENKEKHQLGTLTEGKQPNAKGKFSTHAFDDNYVDNWHQGSAIVISGGQVSHTTITGNFIENCAQGIDVHGDNAIISNNTVTHGMMGIKATHGCRNLIISNNMLTHIDLWGILLNPGQNSYTAQPKTGDTPAKTANVDRGTIIANNIISDYGYGGEYWNWGGKHANKGNSFAMAFYEGQLDTNPPLTDVIIQGNIVYNSGPDGYIENGELVQEGPRYRYAVYVGPWGVENDPGPTFPRTLYFSNNIFHPGAEGVSNVPLDRLR